MNKKVISLALAAMMALGAAPAYAEVDITDEEVVYRVNRDSAGNMNVVIDKTTPALTFTEPLPNNEIRMVVDNKELSARGVSIDGRTLVPLRALGEALGATVEWNADKQEIRIEKMLYQADSNGNVTDSNRIILMNIGSKQSQENGVANDLDVAPQIIGGNTMVPARAITDFLEATIDWEEVSRTVTISSALTSSPQGAQWEQQDLAIGAANATSDYIKRVNEGLQEEWLMREERRRKQDLERGVPSAYGYGVSDVMAFPAVSSKPCLIIEMWASTEKNDLLSEETFIINIMDKGTDTVVYTTKFHYDDYFTLSDGEKIYHDKYITVPNQYLNEDKYDYEVLLDLQ